MGIKKLIDFIRLLGPGIAFAGAAIGVSHLVQSTRAGADYGLQLLWVVLAVCLFKYPFFEFAHRYTSVTGKSVLFGYMALGRYKLLLFLLLNLLLMLITSAGVVIVTAGICASLSSGIETSLASWSLVIGVVCSGLIIIGRYSALDWVMKCIVSTLLLATLAAVLIALPTHLPELIETPTVSPWAIAGIPFMLALMGWMPVPIEISAWQSLWMIEKAKQLGRSILFRESQLDFQIGYAVTITAAVLFLLLGALVVFPTGESFPESGVGFSVRLIGIYSEVLGAWSGGIIGLIAVIAMFSTSLAVIDGYPRSVSRSFRLLLKKDERFERKVQVIFILLCGLSGGLVAKFFLQGLTGLIDFVTVTAFLASPFFAYLNYSLVTSASFPVDHRPSRGLLTLAKFGMVYFVLFALVYLLVIFFEVVTF